MFILSLLTITYKGCRICRIYEFLCLFGATVSGMTQEEKVAVYASDVTHGTNNEYVRLFAG